MVCLAKMKTLFDLPARWMDDCLYGAKPCELFLIDSSTLGTFELIAVEVS